ncbi:hypothetical protein IWZ03DRAFT_443731 [Phyllosticta citriasiana]|uniref:Actin-like ATPase domain-containing protein n=1 Tax=Phyllosticta citriasiana TaxID=595635 RepID=A0ABR1KHU2_9PEZI
MAESGPKIIVGVDYGTTYSGISYVTSNANSIDQIEIINTWPNCDEVVSKVPTRIAYASENSGFSSDKWGFAVPSSSVSYTWTKLLLDSNASLTEYDDPSLRDLFGEGMMRLPRHKKAKQVCADYLKALYEHMVQTLCKRFGDGVYETMPIDLWLTVPAIWSDAAKDATRSAATFAGFGSRPFDRISVISEPEAAALAALKPHLDMNSVDPIRAGEAVLVCDCGGGTVDITTYRILSTQPTLTFEELAGCVGTGGKCGSTYIDRNFNSWMATTFGDAYTSLPAKRRGPGSTFTRSFEAAKRTFGSTSVGRDDVEIDHINMHAPPSPNYDPDEATVIISWYQMKSFFDPVISEIIRLVDSQVVLAKQAGHDISRIILVGGFGNSDYLNERMAAWCAQLGGNIKLTCPPQSQAAVVRGAAIRGLEGIRPVTRLARRHYGYSVCMPFRRGVDPEDKSYIDRFDGRKMCRDRIDWPVSKGEVINSSTEIGFHLTTNIDKDQVPEAMITLYACPRDTPPEHISNQSAEKVGQVHVRFSSSDFDNADKRFNKSMGEDVYRFNLTVKMNMNAEEGILKFKTFAYGKPAGETSIDYHQIEAGAPMSRP